MSARYALVRERRMNDIASSIQAVARIRHGDKPTATDIDVASRDVRDLLNADLYRVTEGERLEAACEVLRRSGFKAAKAEAV